jgi:two-component system chemotaxis sensor kinase CheA
MSLRMVPLKGTFRKMARLVRDLACKAGKEIRLVTEGEETEIDRTMVETLNDPLIHMIRNAVDHGLERPEDRERAGKPAVGTITLRAYHASGNVVIELQDDGNGLDREKIVARAFERGVLQADEDLTDADMFDLIFRPGFSTAQSVTDISGRGVGMDVVKTRIESLRGHVGVASRPGGGATFTLRVPLTMAIADAMLVRVGSQRYLLPTIRIQQSFRPEASSLSSAFDRHGWMVMVRGELLPIFRLSEIFGVPDAVADPREGLLILLEGKGRRCALMVDEILGQQQVVIKSLGPALGKIPGVAGSAILGDGRVGLILDVGGLLTLATEARRPVAA